MNQLQARKKRSLIRQSQRDQITSVFYKTHLVSQRRRSPGSQPHLLFCKGKTQKNRMRFSQPPAVRNGKIVVGPEIRMLANYRPSPECPISHLLSWAFLMLLPVKTATCCGLGTFTVPLERGYRL